MRIEFDPSKLVAESPTNKKEFDVSKLREGELNPEIAKKIKFEQQKPLFETANSLGIPTGPVYKSPYQPGAVTHGPQMETMDEQIKRLQTEIPKKIEDYKEQQRKKEEKDAALKAQYLSVKYLWDRYEPQMSNIAGLTAEEKEALTKRVNDELRVHGYNFNNLRETYDRIERDYNEMQKVNYYNSLPDGKYDSSIDDRTYEYINKEAALKDVTSGTNKKEVQYFGGSYFEVRSMGKYDYMSERERGIYNHLYKTKGENAADEYLDFLNDDLEARQHNKVLENLEKFANENAVTAAAASALSVVMNVGAAVEQIGNYAEYFFTGQMDINKASDYSAVLRQGMANLVDIKIGNFDIFDFAYNATMSGVDTIVVAPLGGGGALVLGLESAASTSNDILRRGGSAEQAFWGGAASGVFEGLFESISIGKINALKDVTETTWKQSLRNFASNVITNASEEALTETANILYDTFINGKISNYAAMYDKYYQAALNSGLSEEQARNEAKSKAINDLLGQVLEAAASGALMGGEFSAVGKVASHKNLSNIGKIIAQNNSQDYIIQTGLSMDSLTDAYKIATNITESGNMSNASLGKLAVQILNDVSAQKSTIASNSIMNYASQLQINESDAKKVAEYFGKAIAQQPISKKEFEAVQNISFSQTVAKELKTKNTWVTDMEAELEQVASVEKRVREAITLPSKTDTQVEAETPELQSNANGENVQPAGVSGTNNGASGNADGVSGSFSGVSGQNSETVVAKNNNTTLDGVINESQVIDLSNDNELAQLLGDTTGAPKYNKIRDYVLGLLGGQKITLSDGKNAIVDKSDALHIANKAASKKISQISKIKEIIEKAELYAEDNDVEHNKFNYFCYYRAFVRVGKDIVPVYLNVGKGINDGKYHIYDITNKIRDTAHRINGVERPKPNEGYALQTVSHDYTVPQDGTGVNNNISDSGEKYSENAENNSNNPVLQSNANGENVQSPGVSGSISGVSGTKNGASGNNSGVRHHTSKAEQEYIKRICDALGIKMKFVHITTKLMAEYGYNFTADTLPDGFYNENDGTLYIGFTGVDPVKFVLKHELTHFGEGTEGYKKFVEDVRSSQAYRDWLIKKGKFDVNEDSWTDIERTVKEKYIEARKAFEPNFGGENAKAEMVADFVGDCLFNNNEAAIERMMSDLDYNQRQTVWQHIKEFLAYLKRKLSGEKNLVLEITRLENRFNRMLSEAVQTKTPTEQNGGVKFSFEGYAEDGKGKYKSNFPQGTPKKAKGERILKYIQEVWSKKPIRLKINEDGVERYIEAKFDPTFDESENIPTDASKLMGGNRHGTAAEKRVTLDLADDYYQIASEARYNYSKDETGKENPTHKDVSRWHYFVNDIYFAEYDSKEYAPYRVTINVKEKSDGEYVYSFSAEKQREFDTPRTLHAVVNDGNNPDANVKLSDNKVTQNTPIVKNNISKDDTNNSEGGLKFTFSRALDEEKIKRAEEIEEDAEGKYGWKEYKYMNIWGETGLAHDPSGVWVYEIDDGEMRIYPDGDRFVKDDPDYQEYRKLSNKKKATNEDFRRIFEIKDKLYEKYGFGSDLLSNYIKHDELFERYPEFNKTKIQFTYLPNGIAGSFNLQNNEIFISNRLLSKGKRLELAQTIIHEIQHAAQYFDKRENGSDIEFWNQRLKLGPLPKNPRTGKEYTPIEAYLATQGEYEARLTEDRLLYEPEDKKGWDFAPYLGNEETLSVSKELERTKGSLKFSVPTNREYLRAVENGDAKTLQQMVDNKAKASGYTERLYHQTDADFTEFNTDNQKAGKYDWELPTGMFLKPSDNDIGLKGKKQMDLYARQQNPLKFRDRSEAQQYWRDNVEGYIAAADKIIAIDTEYRLKSDTASYEVQSYMKRWRTENPDAPRQAIYNDARFQELHDKETLIFEEWGAENDKASLAAKKLIDNYMAQSDYDGIVLENDVGAMGRSTKTYIVFDSSQLKDASPVTYDDSGKVIPLSERFDKGKKDIRFTVPTRDFKKENQDLRRALVESQELTDKVRERLTEHYEGQMKRLEKRYADLKKKLVSGRREISAEITKQREERADKTRNIDCIRRSVSRIDAKLRSNTDAKHVPHELKELAFKMVSAFTFNDTSPFDREKLHAVKAFYNDAYQTAKENPDALNARYDEQVVDMLVRLEESLEGKTLRKMTLSETSQVRSIVEHFEWLINNENKLFIAGKKRDAIQVGLEELGDLTSKKTKRQVVGTDRLEKLIKYNNMTPVYFFDEIGGALRKVFGDIVKGQDKWYCNVELAHAYILDIKEKYHYSEWENDTFSFDTENGEKIEITREQALLLYATARREYGNNLKNTKHLFEGGVVIPPSSSTIKDIFKKYKLLRKNGKLSEAAITALTKEIDSAAHKIAMEDVMKVFDWLTKEQIQYADAFVEYLSNDMALLGNETSMELAGFKKYNESYYIPYNSASNFIASHSAVTSDAKLKHQSFTKSVSYGANTPLILSDFSEVCANHIDRMCMYNALTVPLETMEKIMNFKMPSTDKEGNKIDAEYAGKSVKAELERVYGPESVKYLEQFIKDMNGNVRKTEAETPADKLISKFKKGAVMASASVAIQQPSAIMRAMAYISPKYFVKSKLYNPIRNYEELVKYCAVAGIKEMGRFDTSTGVSTVKWLLRETPKGGKNKVKEFFSFKDSSYRDDILSFGAAWADQITWGHIWAAVKAEVSDKGDYIQGSKEFYEACATRFTFVINHTQVYDSTISRSHLMRSKNTFDNMVSSFMSEPTLSLNMLMSAVRAVGTKTKVGKKFAGRAVAAFISSVLLNAALKSLVTAARDDDEDETYLEKYIAEFRQNFGSDINPVNLIPYIKDAVSIFEGYTVERADMSLVDDLAKSIKMFSNDNKTIDEKLESLAGSLSAFIGVPTKNILRDLRAAWNVIDMSFINKTEGDLQGVIFAATGVEGNAKYEVLVEAAEKGDRTKYDRIYQHLIDRGAEAKDVKTKVKSIYKDSDYVKKQTDKLFKNLATNKTFKSFDEETREDLKKEIAGILAAEKTVKAMVKDIKRFNTLYEYKRTDEEKYKELKQEMIDEGLPENLIAEGEDMAKISYIESLGVDVAEYLLYKKATSVKYADTDGSGYVSKKEKREALENMDIDINSKARDFLLK